MALSGLYLEPFAYMIPPNPKISKFLWENSQSPAPDAQEPLKKRRPPGLIYSLTCSLICSNPRLHIWPVGGIVGPETSPNTPKFRNLYGETSNPLHQIAKNPLD